MYKERKKCREDDPVITRISYMSGAGFELAGRRLPKRLAKQGEGGKYQRHNLLDNQMQRARTRSR
jgi:hypothetical protein